MQPRTKLFICTLTFSIILEVFVRYISPLLFNGRDLFNIFPPIDNIMHFAWGFNFFLVFIILLKWKPNDAFLGVFMWQMFWESLEIIGDLLSPGQEAYWYDHFFFDGIKDTFVDLAGAIVAWYVLIKMGEDFFYQREFSHRRFIIHYAIGVIPLVIIGGIMFAMNYAALGDMASPDAFSVVYLLVLVPVCLFTHSVKSW